jgi:SAM-dependent methyltransferase
MNCPICACEGKQIAGDTSKTLQAYYLRCHGCKTLFSSSVATDDQLNAYYEHYYTNDNLDIPDVAAKSILKTVKSFENFRTDINLLCDIGFGAGALLDAADSQGWNCAGSEFALDAIKLGKTRGWDVHMGSLGPSDLMGPFDVITIVETLEHVSNPRELLNQAAVRIRTGGLIYGTTPNARSLNAYALKDGWSVLSFPEHPVLISKKALKSLLLELGFKNVKISARGFNPFDIILKLKAKSIHTRPQAGRVEYGYDLNSKFSKNSVTRMAKRFINFALTLTNSGDSLVFTAVKVIK